MKTVALVFTCILTSIIGVGQETQGIEIKVTIDNATSDKGLVVAGLHTADTFMKGPGIKNTSSTIENGTATFTFTDVAPGTYAIMALHDENENNRMDYQENGMPKESYGMSGNDMSYGPPVFETAKFEVKEENLEFNIRF